MQCLPLLVSCIFDDIRFDIVMLQLYQDGSYQKLRHCLRTLKLCLEYCGPDTLCIPSCFVMSRITCKGKICCI